jgi:predicted ArsR family transcriptional regulator
MDRLFAAVRDLDPSGFTAKQFSAAYGVQERSARRILGSLTETGHATRSGIQTSPGAGRPNTIYTVDLERLFAETQGTGIEGD